MKETSKFRERYNRWKNGENYWEIRADQDLPKFQSGKDNRSYFDWKTKASAHKDIKIDGDDTYDYEGWYNEDPNRAYDFLNDAPDAHFSDKYKTVKHPTFSDQSIYSGHVNKFNPTGTVGGKWVGNMYIPHKTQIQDKTINYERTRDYLNNAEQSFIAMPKFEGGKDASIRDQMVPVDSVPPFIPSRMMEIGSKQGLSGTDPVAAFIVSAIGPGKFKKVLDLKSAQVLAQRKNRISDTYRSLRECGYSPDKSKKLAHSFLGSNPTDFLVDGMNWLYRKARRVVEPADAVSTAIPM